MKIEKKSKKENIIEIQEEVKIVQDGKEVVLNPGDKIKVFSEGRYGYYLAFQKTGSEVSVQNIETGQEIRLPLSEFEEFVEVGMFTVPRTDLQMIMKGFNIEVIDAVGKDIWYELVEMYL